MREQSSRTQRFSIPRRSGIQRYLNPEVSWPTSPQAKTTAMDFWIVAIDHELQLERSASDTRDRSLEKHQLEALLKAEIPKRKVRFIAEESKIGKATIAFAVGSARIPRIPWKNISMTDAERDAAGIAEALRKRPGHPDHETMSTWIECRIPEDEIREDFFIEETIRGAGDAQSILMLLGDMHVDAVAEKLGRLGHRVATNHSLIPAKRWEERSW
jgi:hypothetical protein